MLEDISATVMSNTSNVASPNEPPPPSRAIPGDKTRIKKWAPKTFNGCLTCKRRRIKCDEGKPSCQRCIKSNLKCSGYAAPKIRLFDPAASSTASTSTVSPATSPGPSSGQEPTTLENTQPHSNPPPHPHPQGHALVPRFGTQEESQSFQFFLEKTSELISVYSQPYLWTVLLPQATWHQPSIKHSLIALASLHRYLTTVGPESQRANHNFVLHYNGAVSALVADKPSIDVVLAACIVFWALENFNGGGQVAVDHMQAAIKILGEWKSKRRANDPAKDFITKYIEPTIRDGVKFASKCRVEELASQMSALSLTTRDVRIMNMDYPAFNSLEDAGEYLEDCIKKILALKNQAPALLSPSPDLIEQVEALDARLYKWMNLFQNLTATGPVYIRRMLVVHNVAANILLDQLKARTQYDKTSGDEQQEDPSHCRFHFTVIEVEDVLKYDPLATVESRRKKPPNLGFIPPVFLAATAAPRVETRTRAIKLLRLLNVTEGPWNTEHAAQVAEKMLEIAQECGAPSSTVELRHIDLEFDQDRRVLSMRWELEDPATLNVSMIKQIDARSMNWDDSHDVPNLIRRFGYQLPPSSVTTLS
ncbi:uncharacterized protein Z520_03634 [Fonsecaea multimorphosa CBS 102226]|uniref:Zn(2)-C6 fungal-type domain-containing protein n=1 Tax=Fonsecaea multimorphosa CBS 102226 TaxID=1442371 RepID=A0A0D2K5A9_9EURO|nr:uncharacterized protein Z520_03634 [Fonsecaea multimorphosa CBS 102226]KIY00968.1 hypothetical protein Z520_03634 [Fonsecaea multimorphosa CBS 102226]